MQIQCIPNGHSAPEVHQRVVDEEPPARGLILEPLLHLLVFGEDVEGEWLLPLLDQVDRLVRGVDGDNREDWTKDLFLQRTL
jgi:hypothetical protein